MDFKNILSKDANFRDILLSSLQHDCEYYLGNGNRYSGNLWGSNEVEHIACMKALWNSFDEKSKPKWLSYDKILDYEQQMGIKAILVEMDYKGYYERFALTPEEFAKEYPETYKNFGPIEESNSDTLKPFVHMWFEPCVVGSDKWNNFFTDMELGLPESDIESGNLAYIDHNQMQSLGKYLEDVSVYHCRAVYQHDNELFAEEEIKLQIMSAVKEPDYVVENMKCVEEGPADGAPDFPDDSFFTFEFDIKLPRDSQTNINTVLDNVDGGELLHQYYVCNENTKDVSKTAVEKPALSEQIHSAELNKQEEVQSGLTVDKSRER